MYVGGYDGMMMVVVVEWMRIAYFHNYQCSILCLFLFVFVSLFAYLYETVD